MNMQRKIETAFKLYLEECFSLLDNPIDIPIYLSKERRATEKEIPCISIKCDIGSHVTLNEAGECNGVRSYSVGIKIESCADDNEDPDIIPEDVHDNYVNETVNALLVSGLARFLSEKVDTFYVYQARETSAPEDNPEGSNFVTNLTYEVKATEVDA